MDRMDIGRTKVLTKLRMKACRKEAEVREEIINVERKGFLMIFLIVVLILFF